MNAIAWLAKSMLENARVLWPLMLLALLAIIPTALSLRSPVTDSGTHSIIAAQRGWWFPLGLLALGLMLSAIDTASSQVLSICALAAILMVPLIHLVWLGITIGRSHHARASVVGTAISQLSIDAVLFMPALSIGTGFGRTWR